MEKDNYPEENKTSEIPVPPPVPSLSTTQTGPVSEQPRLQNNKRAKTYWGGVALLSSLVVFLSLQVVLAIALILFLIATYPISELKSYDQIISAVTAAPWFLIMTQFIMYAGWMGCLWWVTRYRSGVQLGKKFWTAFKENFWVHFKWRDIGIGAGIAAAMMGFQLLILNGLPALFPQIDLSDAGNTSTFEALDGIWFYIIAFGIGSVIGPICEEFFFRGFLMRGFLNHYSYTDTTRNIDLLEDEAAKYSSGLHAIIATMRHWANKHRWALSIVFTSILFGFMHFQGFETIGQWMVIIVTGTLGLVLGYTVYKTRRILPGIIAHVLYNTTSFVILLVSMKS